MTGKLAGAFEHLKILQEYYFRDFDALDIDGMVHRLTGTRILDAEKALDCQLFTSRIHQLAGATFDDPPDGRFTGAEDMAYQRLIWNASRCVILGAAKIGTKVEDDVVFGSLASHDVNAQAVGAPGGGHLILVNSGLFRLLSGLCFGLTLAMPHKGKNSAGYNMFSISPDISLLEENRDAHEAFVSAVTCFANNSRLPGSLVPYAISDPRLHLFLDTFLVAVAFVVAHEYAHIILKHEYKEGGTGEVRIREYASGKREVWMPTHAQVQELQADALGLLICLKAFHPRLDPASIFLGVDLFLCSANIVEVLTGSAASRSHPDMNERWNNVGAVAREACGDEAWKSMTDTSLDVRAIVNHLWECNQERLPAIPD